MPQLAQLEWSPGIRGKSKTPSRNSIDSKACETGKSGEKRQKKTRDGNCSVAAQVQMPSTCTYAVTHLAGLPVQQNASNKRQTLSEANTNSNTNSNAAHESQSWKYSGIRL